MAPNVWGPTPAANTFAHMQGAAQPRHDRHRTPDDRNSPRGLECEVKAEHVHVRKASETNVNASLAVETIGSETIVMAINIHEAIENEEQVDAQQGVSCLCWKARADASREHPICVGRP